MTMSRGYTVATYLVGKNDWAKILLAAEPLVGNRPTGGFYWE